MAIFGSELLANGALPFQATHEGAPGGFTARVFIPAGTTLTDGDFIKFARLADNVQVTKITVRSADLDGGGSPALAAQLGYMRAVQHPYEAYNASTNPAVTGSVGSDSTAFYAAAGAAPLQAGGVVTYVLGQSGLDNEFATATLVNGSNDLAFEITTTANGASAADGYIDVTVEYVGKSRTPGTFSGATAYNYTENFYT